MKAKRNLLNGNKTQLAYAEQSYSLSLAHSRNKAFGMPSQNTTTASAFNNLKAEIFGKIKGEK